MQTPASALTATPKMQGLDVSGGTWYVGQDAASLRTYWVYTPASYQAGTAVPLIMVLHGCMQPYFSHPWAIAYDTHMNQIAEAHQFLVVYPHHFAPPGHQPNILLELFLAREPAPWRGRTGQPGRHCPGHAQQYLPVDD